MKMQIKNNFICIFLISVINLRNIGGYFHHFSLNRSDIFY
jgi:hypothetical protein